MPKCRVEKRVWMDGLRTSDYTCLFHELETDVEPEIGGQVRDGRWFSGPLIRVVWNAEQQTFKCRVEDEAPCIDQDYEYSHEFIVENALHEGWRRCDARGLE